MGTKNFSNANDLITFSRASGGTALRKVAYGPELVTNGTFDSNSDWASTAGWTISGGVASYDGSGGTSSINQDIPVDFVVGRVYQLSLTVVSNTGTGVNNVYVTPTQMVSEKHLDAGTYVFNFSATSTNARVYVYGRSGETLVIDNISIKEVTFDQGDLTLFNHPANIPRIEYDADGNVLGLLVEESRTNLLPYSEDFEQSLYVKDPSVSITSTNNLSPSNENNATLITVTDSQRIYANNTSITGVVSVFIKAGTFSNFKIKTNTVDLVTKTVSAGTLEEFPNGWFRYTSEEATLARFFQIQAYPNDSYLLHSDTGTYYIWGAQLEAGAFPTSYIPTDGATATRSADVASIPVADFGYNQSEGTVVVEGTQYESSASISRFVELYGGGTGSGGSLSLGVYQDNSWIETYNGDVLNLYDVKVSGERQKMASGFDSSGNTFCGDGNILGTPSTSSLVNPVSVSLLYVGVHWSGFQQANGHIKSMKYFHENLLTHNYRS